MIAVGDIYNIISPLYFGEMLFGKVLAIPIPKFEIDTKSSLV